MKHRLLPWLACPDCGAGDLRLETGHTEQRPITRGHFEPERGQPDGVDFEAGTEVEIIDGTLHCEGCGAVFPIQDGIPRMLPRGGASGPESAHRWTTFDSAKQEWEQSFLDYAEPLKPPDFLGRLVLDAGAGYGRHAFYAARYGAEVVALDSSADAVSACQQNTAHATHVHIVQGDLYRLPFLDDLFDIAYCFGVLHHLDDPDRVFSALGEVVRSGGRLSLWVYGARQGATLLVNDALRGVTTRLSADHLHHVSQGIASGLRVFSHTPYAMLYRVPIARQVVSHLPVHDHYKWPFDVVVADIYDRLRIPVKSWFNAERLQKMFTEGGYADVHVSRRVRNTESFRATGVKR